MENSARRLGITADGVFFLAAPTDLGGSLASEGAPAYDA